MIRNRTYRMADGVRIEGTWRPVFFQNGGTFFPSDLLIYADGAIHCGLDRLDLDGLADELARGRIAVDPEPGARASIHNLASWRFAEPSAHLTPENLVDEVADVIDELNDRPTSAQRCRAAIDRYLETRSKEDLIALRDSYLDVPSHQRRYVLGDMDSKDGPLRRLCGIDQNDWEATEALGPEAQWAVQYFEERRPWHRDGPRPLPRGLDDPEPRTPRIVRLTPAWYRDPDDAPPLQRLHNAFPAAVTIAGVEYPSLEHAYWAFTVSDEVDREAVLTAPTGYAAAKIAAASNSRVPDWHLMRKAAMAQLLRMKFAQHPDLAEILIGTEDARIDYGHQDSRFWGSDSRAGGNWMGRLLELVRSELVLARAGLGSGYAPLLDLR